MQFLKTLFWVLVAVVLVLFATRNWFDVTINLWGDIQLDIKLPLLIALAFLIGFLPPFLIQRGRTWALKRRLETYESKQLPYSDAPPATRAHNETLP
jgi:uncharacterized integral membrane protein